MLVVTSASCWSVRNYHPVSVPSRSQRGTREVGLLVVTFCKDLGSGPGVVCPGTWATVGQWLIFDLLAGQPHYTVSKGIKMEEQILLHSSPTCLSFGNGDIGVLPGS